MKNSILIETPQEVVEKYICDTKESTRSKEVASKQKKLKVKLIKLGMNDKQAAMTMDIMINDENSSDKEIISILSDSGVSTDVAKKAIKMRDEFLTI